MVDHGRVIAEGTSDELKDRVGGQRLEVTLADAADAGRAIEALREMSDQDPSAEGSVVALTARQRNGTIVQAVGRLADAGIDVDDLAMRRPTLDDVFLTPDRPSGRNRGGGGPCPGQSVTP